MNKRKKSGLLTFCFSLFPGAGEMYLGFMKMGLSLMGIFFATFILGQSLNMGALICLGIIVWFYSFFHVHNLAGLPDEDFINTEDVYLFNLDEFFSKDKKFVHKYRNIIAAVLIILGIILVWKGIISICYYYLPEVIVRILSRIGHIIPQIVTGIGIILAGFYMIKGKKEELNEIIVDAEPEEVRTYASTAEAGAERSGDGTEENNQNP